MISREDLIEQSVFDYMKEALRARGYTEERVEIMESWQGQLTGELDKSYVAAGFNFDDQGEQAELGSDLKRRLYTIEFFIFGEDATWGRNLANVVKFTLERDGTIPLLDYGQEEAPEIDRLVVVGVSAERQPVNDPEPWQRFIWTTTLRVEDTYSAALV